MSQLDTVKTESELPAPAPKKKGTSFWGVFFRTIWIALFVTVIGISGQIIYDYTRYDNFWVSGDSMYPTLNKDATCSRYPGKTNSGTWGNFTGHSGQDVTYVCDYGLSDSSSTFISKLQRFDIVVAHYDRDFNKEWGGVEANKWNADAVIKRLIGFPGESLYFDTSGNLFVKEVGAADYVLVKQPKAIVDDVDTTTGVNVISQTASTQTISDVSAASELKTFFGSPANPAVMGEKEYYVLGDNRRKGASDDSRKFGPLGIKHRTDEAYPTGDELLSGRAVAITAKRKVVISGSTGKISNHWILSSTLMPWNIKYLGPDGEGGVTANIASSTTSVAGLYLSLRHLWHN